DRDPFATSRRRRAVAQLAAYAGTPDSNDELVQTWQALLFNDPQLIRSVDQILVDRIGKVDATEIEKEIYNLLHGLTTEYVEAGAILGTPSAMQTSQCTMLTMNPLFCPPVAQTTGEIDVRAEITLPNASPSTVSQRIDPQNWAHCPN